MQGLRASKVYLKVESVMVNDHCQRVLWRWFWVRGDALMGTLRSAMLML